MSRLRCSGWVCFHCCSRPAPGCSECVDGMDVDHLGTCADCRALFDEEGAA